MKEMLMFGMWHFMIMDSLIHPILFFLKSIYSKGSQSQGGGPLWDHEPFRTRLWSGRRAPLVCVLYLHKGMCACPPLAQMELLACLPAIHAEPPLFSPLVCKGGNVGEFWSTEPTVMPPPGFCLSLFSLQVVLVWHSFRYILLYKTNHFLRMVQGKLTFMKPFWLFA